MANKNVAVNETSVDGIAEAIKTKTGLDADIAPTQFVNTLNTVIIPSGTKSVTTSTSNVDVTAYASAKISDSYLVTGNIKGGVTILGVAGKASVVETNDGNAAANQIRKGQTLYINGNKITGTGEIYVDGTTLYIPTTGWVN